MRASVLALCFVSVLAIGATATTHVVNSAGTGDYPTIQSAILASATGDTVELVPGGYSGAGNRDLNFWGKAITVRSANGDPEFTSIDCASCRGVTFGSGEGADSVLEGIGFWYADGDVGGGAKCIGSSPTIVNCWFTFGNAVIDGGGLYCVDSSPTLTDCDFNNNSTTGYGGGVYCDSLSAPNFTSCWFGSNSAERGGGLYCDAGDLVLEDCTFRGNTATGNGAGVYAVNDADLSLSLCTFQWNDATVNGGGAYCASAASADFAECTFTENDADKGGGVTLSSPETVTFTDCMFDGNTAQQGAGGAYVYRADTTCCFTRCDFEENSSDVSGGAMHLRNSSPGIIDCDFEGNDAISGSGAAIYCREGSSPTLEGAYFHDNDSATDGGGIYATDSPLAISNSSFWWHDTGADGGAIYSTGARLTLEACHFFDNSATLAGGAVKMVDADSSRIDYCIFSWNEASLTEGAAIACYSTSGVVIENCTLERNQGPADFGAIALLEGSDAVLQNSIVTNTFYTRGVYCDATSDAEAYCTDIFGNDGGTGDWVGCLVFGDMVNHNLWTDPQFCGSAYYDFHVAWESPCLADGMCGQIGALGPACGIRISSVRDVPNDQGRRVYVTWDRAYEDYAYADEPITGYTLWRRIDAKALSSIGSEGKAGELGKGERFPPGTWCYVGDVPAYGEDTYTTSCETVCDSTISGGMCQSVFFVRAGTAVPMTYADSEPDSGHSVDNLVPAIPRGLLANGDEMLVTLSWDPNEDDDLDYYAVYRDTTEGFSPGAPIGYTITEAFEDAAPPEAPEWWYKVSAFDFSGNESDPSDPAGVAGTGVPSGQPTRVWLGPAVPNPFNAATEIHYWIPERERGCGVELLVHDASGRLVRSLVDREIPPGAHSVAWDGRDDGGSLVASGVYFYSMRAADYSDRRKMVLLK